MTINLQHVCFAVGFGALTAAPSLAQDPKVIEAQKVEVQRIVERQKLVEVQKLLTQQKLTDRQTLAAQEALKKLQAARGALVAKASRFAPTPRGFSVVLVVGDLQTAGAVPDNLPEGAKKALVDMKDFLPYRSYALSDVAWIAGCCNLVGRLRGPDQQAYTVSLRSGTAPGGLGGVQMGVSLEEVSPGVANGAPMKGQTVIDTGFGRVAMGETVVVGTSRLNGDKALILLVTPVAAATPGK